MKRVMEVKLEGAPTRQPLALPLIKLEAVPVSSPESEQTPRLPWACVARNRPGRS